MAFAQKIIGWITNRGVEVDANNQMLVALPALPANAGHARIAGPSGNVAEVDANGQLKIAQSPTAAGAGFAKMTGKGAKAGNEAILQAYDGRQIVGMDNVLFTEQADGNAINAARWTQSNTAFSVANSNGWLMLNTLSSTAANSYSLMQSRKAMPILAFATLVVKFSLQLSGIADATTAIEGGVGAVVGNATPTDGAYFRFNGANAQAINNFNGVETAVNIASANRPADNVSFDCKMVIDVDQVQFIINDVLVATIASLAANPSVMNQQRLPVFFRVKTGATVATTAPVIKIGNVLVTQAHLPQFRPWNQSQAMRGFGGYLNPLTGVQVANHTNSTAPAAATLSNTAAGYTTLGGKFSFAAVAGAATDYAIFAFQVPAGHQLKIHRVSVSTVVLGAAVATTPTVLEWAIAVGSTAVSLATVDSIATGVFAPKRVPLGMQSFLLGAAIGTQAAEVERNFQECPLVADANTYVHVILTIPAGTATASETFRGVVNIEAGYE